MTTTNWTQEAEPAERGTATKPVRTPAPPGAAPVKSSLDQLAQHVAAAREDHEREVERVRRVELGPYVEEAAKLYTVFMDLEAVYGEKLEKIIRLVRAPDLMRYHGIDDARTYLFTVASNTLRSIRAGIRQTGNVALRARAITWDDVQTKRYLDIIDMVSGVRELPASIPGSVRECERVLDSINAKIAKQQPTRKLVEIDLSTPPPPRQDHADADYNPFEVRS